MKSDATTVKEKQASEMNETKEFEHRTIVVGLVWNRKKELLLCKMPGNRGVFPGQWGLPGGGIEANETMTNALRREIREELGIEIQAIKPAFFKDGQYQKSFPDGSKKEVYMIFLLFHCIALHEKITLNEEFSEFKWVQEHELANFKMNQETVDTLSKIGNWDDVWS